MKSIFASQIYFSLFASQTDFPHLIRIKTSLAFLYPFSRNIYCLVCICSILSLKISVFLLNFQGCITVYLSRSAAACQFLLNTQRWYIITSAAGRQYLFLNFFTKDLWPAFARAKHRLLFAVGLYNSTPLCCLSISFCTFFIRFFACDFLLPFFSAHLLWFWACLSSCLLPVTIHIKRLPHLHASYDPADW